jgi:hypothetical protein
MRVATTAVLLVALGLALGCGGGRDGPAGGSVELFVAAFEGAEAPGTGGGTFSALPGSPLMVAADGGWAAFTAAIAGGTTSTMLYVVQPDGIVVPVFALGDPAVAPSTGTISAFGRLWLTRDGVVYVTVSIAGDATRTFGLLTARVAGGVVADTTAPLYDGDLLPAPLMGTLSGIRDTDAKLEPDGTYWFVGTDDDTGRQNLMSVERDGSLLALHAEIEDELPGLTELTAIQQFGMDETGTWYGIVASTSVGEDRIYMRQRDTAPYLEVLSRNQTIMTEDNNGNEVTRTITDPHRAGPLVLYPGGRMVWLASGNAGWMFMRSDTGPGQAILRQNDFAPGTGTGIGSEEEATRGRFTSTIVFLSQALNPSEMHFRAGITAAGNGTTAGIFRLISERGAVQPAIQVGQGTPSGVNGVVGPTFPGVDTGYPKASSNGSLVFANVTIDPGDPLGNTIRETGIFWIRGTQLETVAVAGAPTPEGGTFEQFLGGTTSGLGYTGADGIVLFRGDTREGDTGLYLAR